MKEAKTVLIGSIRNEGKLVRKDPHQSLISKVKKKVYSNVFHHQSLFSNPKKIQMCFKSKSLAFGRRLEATGPRTNSLFQSKSGMSSLWVPGVPWHPQILADQLTISQPGGTDYAHLITTGTPGFPDLPTALQILYKTDVSKVCSALQFTN